MWGGGDCPEHQSKHGVPADPALGPGRSRLPGQLLPDGGAARGLYGHIAAPHAGQNPGLGQRHCWPTQEGGHTTNLVVIKRVGQNLNKETFPCFKHAMQLTMTGLPAHFI